MKSFFAAILMLLCVLMCGCSDKYYSVGFNDGYEKGHYDGREDGYDDGYSDGYNDAYNDFCDAPYSVDYNATFDEAELYYNLPDMALLCEEISSQGYGECYQYFFEIAEKIGYFPSAFLGNYLLDSSTSAIHKTDSECVYNIAYRNMQFPFINSLQDILDEVLDDDTYLQGYLFCAECFK